MWQSHTSVRHHTTTTVEGTHFNNEDSEQWWEQVLWRQDISFYTPCPWNYYIGLLYWAQCTGRVIEVPCVGEILVTQESSLLQILCNTE